MKKFYYLTVVLSLGLFATTISAQTFQSCDQWASWNINGYTIYNNIWGSGAGTQCLWAYSEGNWGVWADHPNTDGIKAYPNVGRDVSYTVSSMPDITASFSVSRPGSGSYNTAFDIWYNSSSYEIMLWMNWNGSMGPISYNYGCSGYPSTACPVRTNVSVGGHTWNLYQGTNGSATVYSFLRTGNTNSGTVNITQISQWLANNGYFSSSANLHKIQFGFEISQSSGGADFVVNSYAVNIGSSSGGGSTGGTYYTLQNRNSGKYADVSGVSQSDGANIIQWSSTGGANQQWEMVDAGSGYIYLKASHSGKCMRGVNGNVVQYSCNTGWWTEMFERVDAGSGYYILKNRNSGTCLRIENSSTSNGASIILDNCNTGYWSEQFLFSATKSADESIETIKPLSEIEIYPNPANNYLNIVLPDDMQENISIRIVNSLGQVNIDKHDLSGELNTIDISNLDAGLYVVHVSKNQDVINKLFTKN